MDVPGVMDKDDPFYHRLTPVQKEQYKSLIEKWTDIYTPTYLDRINYEISTEYEHLNMVQTCVRAFCNTEASTKAGFVFFCAEPLIEFGSQEKGFKSFDLLIYNESRRKPIFIECKSSVRKVKKAIEEIKSSVQRVHENEEYLSKRMQENVSWDDCEYVLCVAVKDSEKIYDFLQEKDQTWKLRSTDIQGLVIWVYHPYRDTIQVSEHFLHNDSALNDLLQIGIKKEAKKDKIDLPYCITSHHFIIIEQCIIGQCYAKQYAKKSIIKDPKLITRNMVMNAMVNSISLVASRSDKHKMVKQKMEEVIAYGKKYEILIDQDTDSFKINCRGGRIPTVLKAIREKFIENWALVHAKRDARSRAEEEMGKTISQREITDF